MNLHQQLLHKTRILLKPWWAKLCALVIFCLILFSFTCINIYYGYHHEQNILKQYDYILYDRYVNILPKWLHQYRAIAQYGRRIESIGYHEYTAKKNPVIPDEAWSKLGKMKYLKVLSISAVHLDDAVLKNHIATIPHLEELHIVNTVLTDQSLKVFRKMDNLIWLNIGTTNMTPQGQKELHKLEKLSLTRGKCANRLN